MRRGTTEVAPSTPAPGGDLRGARRPEAGHPVRPVDPSARLRHPARAAARTERAREAACPAVPWQLDPAVPAGVLHVSASAASCDDDPDDLHPACHLHQQAWTIPVRLTEGRRTVCRWCCAGPHVDWHRRVPTPPLSPPHGREGKGREDRCRPPPAAPTGTADARRPGLTPRHG